jgi:hypothetical protein
MSVKRRKFASLYIPALAIALMLLYYALVDIQSSTAEMMPAAMKLEAVESANSEDMVAAADVLKQRLSTYLQEDISLNLVVEGGQLSVSLPPGVEPSLLLAEAGRIGRIELVDGGTQFLTTGSRVKTAPHPIPDQNVYQTVLTNQDFETVEAQVNGQNRPVIRFTLTPAGDARLAAHTAELRGYYLCLVVDSRVMNCPILRTPLTHRTGNIELTGDATIDDARALTVLLRSGPLPVRFRLSSN